jgi:hypothetical protein
MVSTHDNRLQTLKLIDDGINVYDQLNCAFNVLNYDTVLCCAHNYDRNYMFDSASGTSHDD